MTTAYDTKWYEISRSIPGNPEMDFIRLTCPVEARRWWDLLQLVEPGNGTLEANVYGESYDMNDPEDWNKRYELPVTPCSSCGKPIGANDSPMVCLTCNA